MTERYPIAPRALAGIGAAAFALLGANVTLNFFTMGCSAAAAVVGLAALLLAGFLALLAASPATLQPFLTRRTKIDLRDAGHATAAVVMASTLGFLLGLGSLVNPTLIVESATSRSCNIDATGGAMPDASALMSSAIQNMAIFILPVLLYVSFVHGRGPAGTLRLLGLKGEGSARALLVGFALAIAFFVAFGILASILAQFVGQEALENPRALEMARALTPAGALLLAVTSSVGEEIFYRGFLQPRFGLLLTTTLFALAHFSYGSVSEVVVVFALSLLMGLLYRKTGNLWAPIGVHFMFNLVNLLLGQFMPETA